MANYSIWALGESQLSISGGGQLDGVTQGDGSHLLGLTVTLNSFNFQELFIRDRGSDSNFDDNDGNQRLQGAQTFDGVSYSNNTTIEAEYRITLRDPDSGILYDALAINFRTTSPSYGTIEGISFVDVIPPAGVALEVIDAFEGPGASGQPSIDQSEVAVPACFTPGTSIETPYGPRRVETLRAGDLVTTYDKGPEPLLWVGQTVFARQDLRKRPEMRPILIRKDAFGPGIPCRDMRVSPLHRILLSGPAAELLFGEPEVLAAAQHLVDGDRICVDTCARRVIYLHVQCAAHELLISDGLPSESYNPGPLSIRSSSQTLQTRLLSAMTKGVSSSGMPLDADRTEVTWHHAALWPVAACAAPAWLAVGWLGAGVLFRVAKA